MATEPKKASFGLAFLGAIVLFAAGGAVISFWSGKSADSANDYEAKRAANRIAKREELVKEADQKLHTAAVVDQAKGIAQIPIEKAMQLVAVELKQKPVGLSAVQVEKPYPYGLGRPNAPATSGSAAPAPAAAGAPAAPASTPAAKS